MDCKITSLTKQRRKTIGMTLMEMLIALLIGSFVLGGLLALGSYTTRSFAALGNYMELDKNSRNTLDRMTQIIRESDGLLDWSNHQITLSYHTKPMSFTYS